MGALDRMMDEYGDMDEIMTILEDVVFDNDHLTGYCSVCGMEIYPLEPDADSAYCDDCECVQPIDNPLMELGII